MKKITTACAAVALAFFQLLPASAQSEVHLKFTRNGANASDVVVSVTDGSGNDISGASATLESVQKGNGLDNFSSFTETTLQTTGNMETDTDVLCAVYDNKQYSFSQFIFKLSGLDDYAFQNAEMNVAALNKSGQYQQYMHRKFTFQVWDVSSDNIKKENALYTLTDQDVTDGGTTAGANNTKNYKLNGTKVNFTTSTNQYLIVRFTYTESDGCFIGLREITLKQMTYSVTPATTNNLGKVATFSAGTNVKFDANTTAYIATENGSNSVTLSKLTGDVLEAGKGAVLITTGEAITATPTSTESKDDRTNYLVGSGDATKELTDATTTYYILNKNSESNAVFSLLNSSSGTTLAANKAALAIANGSSNALSINFEGSTTGIGTATTGITTSSSRIYNLQGQAVTGKLAKGVYVQGGKKFIVK